MGVNSPSLLTVYDTSIKWFSYKQSRLVVPKLFHIGTPWHSISILYSPPWGLGKGGGVNKWNLFIGYRIAPKRCHTLWHMADVQPVQYVSQIYSVLILTEASKRTLCLGSSSGSPPVSQLSSQDPGLLCTLDSSGPWTQVTWLRTQDFSLKRAHQSAGDWLSYRPKL